MALRGQQSVRGDYELPMIPERLDMAAYTYSYHMDGGCVPQDDPFWGNFDARTAM